MHAQCLLRHKANIVYSAKFKSAHVSQNVKIIHSILRPVLSLHTLAMCLFIQIRYACRHKTLVTTANGVNLCIEALEFGLRQGVDVAPANCFPIPDDVDNPRTIFAENVDLGHCQGCCEKYCIIPPAPAGKFLSSDTEQLREFGLHVESCRQHAVQMSESLEADVQLRSKISVFEHEWLRNMFTQDGPEKYKKLFLDDLEQVLSWIVHLHTYIEQAVPVEMFRRALNFVVQKNLKAVEKVQFFGILVDHISGVDPQPGKNQERVCQIVEILRRLVEGSEEIPSGFEYLQGGPTPPLPPRSCSEKEGFSVPDTPSDSGASERKGSAQRTRDRCNRPQLRVEIHAVTPGRQNPEIVQVTSAEQRAHLAANFHQMALNDASMIAIPMTPAQSPLPKSSSGNTCFCL